MKLVDTLFNQIPELKPMSGVCRDSLTRIGACQMSVLRGTYRSKYEKYEDFIDVDGWVKIEVLSVLGYHPCTSATILQQPSCPLQTSPLTHKNYSDSEFLANWLVKFSNCVIFCEHPQMKNQISSTGPFFRVSVYSTMDQAIFRTWMKLRKWLLNDYK